MNTVAQLLEEQHQDICNCLLVFRVGEPKASKVIKWKLGLAAAIREAAGIARVQAGEEIDEH